MIWYIIKTKEHMGKLSPGNSKMSRRQKKTFGQNRKTVDLLKSTILEEEHPEMFTDNDFYTCNPGPTFSG